MERIKSKLVHGNIEKYKEQHHSLRYPVYDSVAFYFNTAEEIEASFKGEINAFTYSRVSNPTIIDFEKRINFVTGGIGSLAVSSGMAAIANTVFSVCEQGDNVISTKYLFGHTYSFFNNTIASFGIHAKFTDLENINELEDAIDEKTRLIFLENITNPQLILFDIEAIAEIAKRHNILLVVDNTVATPYLFQSQAWGIDIEVISSTKAISGGATSVGGIITAFESKKWQHVPKLKAYFDHFGNEALPRFLRKELYRNLGNCTSPHNAYLQTLGLETLGIRMDKISDNAYQLASHLKEIPEIYHVNHPALEDSPYYQYANKYFSGKAGCFVTFELKDKDACFRFMNKLKMIRRATNFCDNKSLIIHPDSTIYAEYSPEKRLELLVNENMIRLSAGIEDMADITNDIKQALND